MERMEESTSGVSQLPMNVSEPLDKRLGRDHLVELLDEVERQVERLRSQAAVLEDEKDAISTAIDSIRQSDYVDDLQEGDREEMLFSIERLGARVATVEVAVRTARDSNQEEALCDVNVLIDRLVVDMRRDVDGAKSRCLSFLNTCGSEPGPVDKDFEVALLGCALDDQKKIRKRLHGLLSYIDKFSVVPLAD